MEPVEDKKRIEEAVLDKIERELVSRVRESRSSSDESSQLVEIIDRLAARIVRESIRERVFRNVERGVSIP